MRYKIKDMSVEKRVMFIIITSAVLFGIYCLVWFILKNNAYGNFKKVNGSRFSDEDGYVYEVFEPKFLSYTGNLSVIDPYGNDVIIWVSLLGENEYGYSIDDGDGNMYGFYYADEKLNAVDGTQQSDIDENIEIIRALYEHANTAWELI